MITELGQFNVNFEGATARRIFLDPIFKDVQPFEGDIYQVMPNVVSRKNMVFVGPLDNYLRKRIGCGFNPTGSLNVSERQVEVELVKGETQQCWDEFKDTILMEALNKGVDMGNMEGTLMQDIILTRMQQGASRQINLLAWFGDKSSVNPEQNICDGMWTKYIPELQANNLIRVVDSNSGTPLGAGGAIDLLDAVLDSASNELKALPVGDRRLIVSNNIAEQLEKDIRNGVAGDSAFIREVEDGRMTMLFRGVQIVSMLRWQGLYEQYLGVADANLVLYTARQNLILATDRISDTTSIDGWFEKKEEAMYFRTAFKLGFNYIHPSLMVAAK